jgi:hypothetical protein
VRAAYSLEHVLVYDSREGNMTCLARIVMSLCLACFAASSRAGGIFGELERVVRQSTAASIGVLVSDADKASVALAVAKANVVPAAQLSELERRKQEAEAAVMEQERQIRIRVEERAVLALEAGLGSIKTIPYKVDRIAYIAISNSLYGKGLELQPMIYENYVFLQIEPRKIASSGDSEISLRAVVYWKRNDDRVAIRYAALEKRLRSSEPRVVTEPQTKALADDFVSSLAKALERRGAQ